MEVYSKSVHEAPECRKSLQSTLRPRSKCRERFGIAHPDRCGSAVESLLCFPLLLSSLHPVPMSFGIASTRLSSKRLCAWFYAQSDHPI